jgi:lipid-A-disaccharide synthase
MHVFISAGEPSGDLHGANLIKALKRLDPQVRITGFGGEKMLAEGLQQVYPLAKHSLMWFQVVRQIKTFVKLLNDAQTFLRQEKPDVVVTIDYPGFHWKLAERAQREGIPAVYFVPPQIWAWARWRVKKMKRLFPHVLSCLPFEHDWLSKRGVPSTFIGHPYFDELTQQTPDADFLTAQRSQPGRIVGILPGSRNQEVSRNIPEMLRAARRIAKEQPDVRFLVAAFNEHQAAMARREVERWGMPVEVFVGRTPEIIELSECCIAVSGSVSLELMFRRKPSCIVYRLSRFEMRVARGMKKVPYITLVNLLAEAEVFPEFLCDRDPSERVASQIRSWLNDPAKRDRVVDRLAELNATVAAPGACDRAARFLLARFLLADGQGV